MAAADLPSWALFPGELMGRPCCPHCGAEPLQVWRSRRGEPLCANCGSLLQRRRPGRRGRDRAGDSGGGLLVLLLVLLALLAMAAWDQLIGRVGLTSSAPLLQRLVDRVTPESPRPLPVEQQPLRLLDGGLLERLSAADQQWLPRVEPLPDGGQRYLYKRRLGDPALTLEQIRALIADPPTYAAEQQAIQDLLVALQQAGVRITLEQPHKAGAAAEWDHALRTLRIKPSVVEEGSLEFARVLNHEALHVAQSCRGGDLAARPVALGLNRQLPPELAAQLPELVAAGGAGGGRSAESSGRASLSLSVYSDASPQERQLEQEAYANQHRLDLGAALVRRHCRAVSG